MSDLATIIVGELIRVSGDRARSEERERESERSRESIRERVIVLQRENDRLTADKDRMAETAMTIARDRDQERNQRQTMFNALTNLKSAASDFLTRVECQPRSSKNLGSGEAVELRHRIAEAQKIYDAEIPF